MTPYQYIKSLEDTNARLISVIETLEALVQKQDPLLVAKCPSMPKAHDWDDVPLPTQVSHKSPQHPLANHDWDK